jgi:hypothetical protein
MNAMDKESQIPSRYRRAAVWIEWLLALVILGGVLVFGVQSAQVMATLDWRLTETFYELIFRVLLLVIAIELARTLVTHDLRAVLELLAFVIARKMLKPDLGALDILLSTLGFVALLAANRYWLSSPSPRERKEPANTT